MHKAIMPSVLSCFLAPFKSHEQNNNYLYMQKHAVIQNIYSQEPKKSIIQYSALKNTRFYKVRYGYTTNSPEELSLKIGDIVEVEVTHDSRQKLRGRLLNCKRIGYLSKNNLHCSSIYECKPWFFSNITRPETDEMLLAENIENGTFIVRHSMTNDYNPFTLSLRSQNENLEPIIKHYKIFKGSYGYYISPRLTFESIENLIDTYLSDVSRLFGLHYRLTSPPFREQKYIGQV